MMKTILLLCLLASLLLSSIASAGTYSAVVGNCFQLGQGQACYVNIIDAAGKIVLTDVVVNTGSMPDAVAAYLARITNSLNNPPIQPGGPQ